jgi:hypothetical protein
MQYTFTLRGRNSNGEVFTRTFDLNTQDYAEKYITLDELKDSVDMLEHAVNDPEYWDSIISPEQVDEEGIDLAELDYGSQN